MQNDTNETLTIHPIVIPRTARWTLATILAWGYLAAALVVAALLWGLGDRRPSARYCCSWGVGCSCCLSWCSFPSSHGFALASSFPLARRGDGRHRSRDGLPNRLATAASRSHRPPRSRGDVQRRRGRRARPDPADLPRALAAPGRRFPGMRRAAGRRTRAHRRLAPAREPGPVPPQPLSDPIRRRDGPQRPRSRQAERGEGDRGSRLRRAFRSRRSREARSDSATSTSRRLARDSRA